MFWRRRLAPTSPSDVDHRARNDLARGSDWRKLQAALSWCDDIGAEGDGDKFGDLEHRHFRLRMRAFARR